MPNILGTSINATQGKGLILYMNKRWETVNPNTKRALYRRGLLKKTAPPELTDFGWRVVHQLLARKFYNDFANETKPIAYTPSQQPERGSVAWLMAQLKNMDPKAHVLIFAHPWDMAELEDIDGYAIGVVEPISATVTEYGVPVNEMLEDSELFPHGVVVIRMSDSD